MPRSGPPDGPPAAAAPAREPRGGPVPAKQEETRVVFPAPGAASIMSVFASARCATMPGIKGSMGRRIVAPAIWSPANSPGSLRLRRPSERDHPIARRGRPDVPPSVVLVRRYVHDIARPDLALLAL